MLKCRHEVGPGPLLFLGACRITYVLGESIENAPVAEGLGNIPQTHNRPRKGGTRANAVVRQALWNHTAPRRLHDASATGSRRIRDASVPANPEIRLTNLTTYNQRPNPPPPPPRQSSHPCLVLKGRLGSGSYPFSWHAIESQCVLHTLFRDFLERWAYTYCTKPVSEV